MTKLNDKNPTVPTPQLDDNSQKPVNTEWFNQAVQETWDIFGGSAEDDFDEAPQDVNENK